jgi:hypothetical protein
MTLTLALTRAEEKTLLQAAQAAFPGLAVVRSLETQEPQVSAKVGLPIGEVEVRVALVVTDT